MSLLFSRGPPSLYPSGSGSGFLFGSPPPQHPKPHPGETWRAGVLRGLGPSRSLTKTLRELNHTPLPVWQIPSGSRGGWPPYPRRIPHPAGTPSRGPAFSKLGTKRRAPEGARLLCVARFGYLVTERSCGPRAHRRPEGHRHRAPAARRHPSRGEPSRPEPSTGPRRPSKRCSRKKR
jgi:hypothetical protein